MSFGLANIGFTNNTVTNAAPAVPVTGANNGLSVSGNNAQIGQTIGAAGDPAQLLSNREVPLKGFSLDFLGNNVQLFIDDANKQISLGDTIGGNNGTYIFLDDNTGEIAMGDFGGIGSSGYMYFDTINYYYEIDFGSASTFRLDQGSDLYALGPINAGNQTQVRVKDTPQTIELRAGNGFFTSAPNGAGSEGKWRLGKKIVAASVFDGGNYVEVNIEGAVLKLALVV